MSAVPSFGRILSFFLFLSFFSFSRFLVCLAVWFVVHLISVYSIYIAILSLEWLCSRSIARYPLEQKKKVYILRLVECT